METNTMLLLFCIAIIAFAAIRDYRIIKQSKKPERYGQDPGETFMSIRESNKKLSYELAKTKAANNKIAKNFYEQSKELSTVRNHFQHLDRVAHNQRTDLEDLNKINTLQREEIEEFKKQVKGLKYKNGNQANNNATLREIIDEQRAEKQELIKAYETHVKAAESALDRSYEQAEFFKKVRDAQAQTIKEYGEKYGYGEEARKPAFISADFADGPDTTVRAKAYKDQIQGSWVYESLPDTKECPSCVGGKRRRPYTKNTMDDCLDCEGLGELYAVNTPIGTQYYKKSSADRQNDARDKAAAQAQAEIDKHIAVSKLADLKDEEPIYKQTATFEVKGCHTCHGNGAYNAPAYWKDGTPKGSCIEVTCPDCKGNGVYTEPATSEAVEDFNKPKPLLTKSLKWWNSLSDSSRTALIDKYPMSDLGKRKNLRGIWLAETGPKNE